MNPAETADEQGYILADISVSVNGDRRMLESIYLELRELALRNGLEIKYRLTPAPIQD
jgi:hypothetical protein